MMTLTEIIGSRFGKVLRNFRIQDRNVDDKHAYTFDHVYKDSATTQEIFKRGISQMIYNASQGYNVTILAYGQTSSGKTYTMTGGKDHSGQHQSGIIGLTAVQLFQTIDHLKSHEGIEQSLSEQAQNPSSQPLAAAHSQQSQPSCMRSDDTGLQS